MNYIENFKKRYCQNNICLNIVNYIEDYNIKNKAYYLTVSKRSNNIKNPKEFLAKIDLCLQDIKQNGEYKIILSKYGIY